MMEMWWLVNDRPILCDKKWRFSSQLFQKEWQSWNCVNPSVSGTDARWCTSGRYGNICWLWSNKFHTCASAKRTTLSPTCPGKPAASLIKDRKTQLVKQYQLANPKFWCLPLTSCCILCWLWWEREQGSLAQRCLCLGFSSASHPSVGDEVRRSMHWAARNWCPPPHVALQELHGPRQIIIFG
jgi:hypothetical protein